MKYKTVHGINKCFSVQGQIAEPQLSLNSLTHVRAWHLTRHEISDWLPYVSHQEGIK